MSSDTVPEAGEDTPGGNTMTDPGLIPPPREPNIDREPPESSKNEPNKSSTAFAVSPRSDTERKASGSESDVDTREQYDPFDSLRRLPPLPPLPDDYSKLDKKLEKAKAKRPMRYQKDIISHNVDNFGSLLKILGDRIAFLEYEIETMRQVPKQPLTYPVPPALPLTYSITEYGDYNWFNRRDFRAHLQPKYVIEVNLIADTNGVCSFLASHQDRFLDVDGGKCIREDESGPTATFEGANPLPHKVRITSSYLLTCLRELSKETTLFFDGSVIFIPPFKMFIRYEKEIRAMFKDAEAEVESHRQRELSASQQKISSSDEDERSKVPKGKDSRKTSPSTSPDPGTRHDPEKEAKKFEYMQFKCEHLRLLVNFFDGPFNPILNLYHSIKARTITQIPFDYLWYLFHHGQEVVQQGAHLQVSRVLRFTGGRDTATSVKSTGLPNTIPTVSSRGIARNLITKSSFHVDCYFWEFDGEGFRPVVETIDIKPYTGFRDIASLPVYPLAFHEKIGTIRRQLLERGDKFLSLSKKNEVVHRHYTGLTLESNCTNAEEVRLHFVNWVLQMIEIITWAYLNDPDRLPHHHRPAISDPGEANMEATRVHICAHELRYS